jgi:hypothetical protein
MKLYQQAGYQSRFTFRAIALFKDFSLLEILPKILKAATSKNCPVKTKIVILTVPKLVKK